MEQILEFLKPFIESLAGQHGIIAQVLAVLASVVGIARTLIKPIRDIAKEVEKLTKTTKDDELLAKVEGSKWVALIAWVVDYLLSIKLPAKKAPEAIK